MSDIGVGRDQLRAFVERIEPPLHRIAYALSCFDRCRGHSVRSTNRAYDLCAQLFGCDYEVAKRVIWLSDFGREDRAVQLVGRLNPKRAGWVYQATCPTFPQLTKVGFTTDPVKRQKSLSSIYGAPVDLVPVEVGTMLAEHAQHCDLKDKRVEGEWFSLELSAA